MKKSRLIAKKEYRLKEELPLDHPFLNIKHLQKLIPDITYRKINDWDENGLILQSRKTKNTGWRFFSILDVVRIKIVSELRRFGLKTNLIKKVLNNLPAIELANNKITLLIDTNGKISLCSNGQGALLDVRTALLMLPINTYFNEISKRIEDNKDLFFKTSTVEQVTTN